MTTEPALLERRRGRMIASVGLGLTLYFATAPTCDEVIACYRAFRLRAPADLPWQVRNVRGPMFRMLQADDTRQVRQLLRDQDRRRDEGLVVWSGSTEAGWSFWMQGAVVPEDPSLPCASFCQVAMPRQTRPAVLRALAGALADALPVMSGHGGYTALFDAWVKHRAFNRIFAWAKRFPGLEVEDLNVTLHSVIGKIKGANWLTLVGDPLAAGLADGVLDSLPADTGVERHGAARLLIAGPAPTLGDRNRNAFPHAYAAVEQVLAPLKVTSHGDFAGRFSEEDNTRAWLYRLLQRDRW